METLLEIVKSVWTTRARIAHKWPTPNERDAIRFAFTEAAEAVDAVLRCKHYRRNHERADANPCYELAQCAIMLITALGPNHAYSSWTLPDDAPESFDERVDMIAAYAAEAYYSYVIRGGASLWSAYAELALMFILRERGCWNIEEMIELELARQEAKP